jgi:hypothetical protein
MLVIFQNFYMGVKLETLQLRNGNEEFRGILVTKLEAVTGACRKMRNEQPHNTHTYSRPNTVGVVKLRVRW